MNKPHILITGERGIGKSTLVNRLLAHCTVPIYGYKTKNVSGEDGHSIGVYIYPANSTSFVNTEENCAASPIGKEKTGMDVHLDVFNTLGVEYLKNAQPDGWIVMDELGYLETKATEFRSAVLERLDGDVPVLAVVRLNKDTDFLNQVRRHPKAELYTVTEENRDSLYEVLKSRMEAVRG